MFLGMYCPYLGLTPMGMSVQGNHYNQSCILLFVQEWRVVVVAAAVVAAVLGVEALEVALAGVPRQVWGACSQAACQNWNQLENGANLALEVLWMTSESPQL